MGQENRGIGGIGLKRFWEYGILVLDGEKSCAFVFEEDLQLTKQECDTLYSLMKKLLMELRYALRRYMGGEGSSRIQSGARKVLENLLLKLNQAGRGGWIDRVAGDYTWLCLKK